jgi:hypothetical protein
VTGLRADHRSKPLAVSREPIARRTNANETNRKIESEKR